jgi:monoamine oxidase
LRHWPKQARAIAAADVETEYAAGLSELSMANVLFEWAAWGTSHGDQRLRDQPYTSLIDRSIKALGTRVRCGERVATVIQGGGSGRSVEVLTETGRSYLARCAIVAVPLGVLKARRPEFVPNLCAQKREAIRKLGMGDTVKVVVRLDSPLRHRYKYNYVCSDLSIPVWSRSDPFRDGPVLLVGWAGGPKARGLRTRSEDKIRVQARESLKRIAPQLPDIDDDNIRVMNWSTELDTLGSYSFVPPGAEGLRPVLAHPEGKVLFAGEATHCRYPATVTGAALSGQRAALEALGVLG